MEFLEISESINIEDLAQVEKELNMRFSDNFKAHYLKYNGGYPEKDKFLWHNGETTTINTFFSIKHKGFVSMEFTYKDLVFVEDYLPEKILPFAVDDGGNFFCVSFRDNDYQHVYYCNDDHYNSKDNEEYLTLLTVSFGLFIETLV